MHHALHQSIRAIREWIRIRRPCPTYTRICSAKEASQARGSTMSMHLSKRRMADFREHASQSRLDRRRICPRGSRDRHRSLRRLSGSLSDLHAEKASMDSRRLAAPSLAWPDRSRDRQSNAQPPVRDLALEDLRQPAAQCCEISQFVLLFAGWFLLRDLRFLDCNLTSAQSRRRGSSLFCSSVMRPPRDQSWLAYYAAVGRDLGVSVQQLRWR